MRITNALLLVAALAIPAGASRAAVPPAEGVPAASMAAPSTPYRVDPPSSLLRAFGVPDCACEADPEALRAHRDEIARSASLEEAREKALAPTRVAREAVGWAARLMPWSDELDQADARLAAYETRVAEAGSVEEAANEFGSLVQLAAADGGILADVEFEDIDAEDTSCSYTAAEIIAIVFGFILFIIPGIILLIVFC